MGSCQVRLELCDDQWCSIERDGFWSTSSRLRGSLDETQDIEGIGIPLEDPNDTPVRKRLAKRKGLLPSTKRESVSPVQPPPASRDKGKATTFEDRSYVSSSWDERLPNSPPNNSVSFSGRPQAKVARTVESYNVTKSSLPPPPGPPPANQLVVIDLPPSSTPPTSPPQRPSGMAA
uniref:Uncharacterized protein n=1 Tax=Cannabis sativa TaxID=3483 RepID=A0A803PIM6_CANSA